MSIARKCRERQENVKISGIDQRSEKENLAIQRIDRRNNVNRKKVVE
jgi:hypothetical protein